MSNSGYINIPVTTDPDQLQAAALAEISQNLPGWVPREGHIEVLLLEQFAAMAAESAQVAAQVPEAIFSYFGTLINIRPEQGSYATAQTTWTMTDTLGWTVPANTIVGYAVLGNSIYLFQTLEAFTVPSGEIQTSPGAITVTSMQVGETYNGLAIGDLTLVNPSLKYVAQIQSTTVTSGGSNVETTDAYLDRLSAELQLLTPRPILAKDYAAIAPSVAGVYRASAFNGLNPYANILIQEDSTFNGGIGSWVNTQNCALTTHAGAGGENVLRITAGSGGTSAIATSGLYSASPSSPYVAMITLDHASASRSITFSATALDVNGSPLGTFSAPAFTDSTSAFTFAYVAFNTPVNTFDLKLSITVASPATSETHDATFIVLAEGAAPTNLIPDSSALQVAAADTWALSSGITTDIFATGTNGFFYTGTGGASGTKTALSTPAYIPVGSYTASSFIDASNVTSGTPEFLVKVNGSTVATKTQTMGVAGIVTTTFTVSGSPGLVQFEFSTDNCTVQSGLPLTFAQPQVLLGSYTVYTPGPTFSAPGEITGNERMVTVAPVDVDGEPVGETISQNLQTYLQSQRETNFIVNVIDPSYTSIDVTWFGVSDGTISNDAVEAAANAALESYLSPAIWGGGNDTPPMWDSSQQTVRYLSIVTLLGETPGMAFLDSVAIGYHDGSMGDTDLDLIGYAPLPVVGNISGTVNNA